MTKKVEKFSTRFLDDQNGEYGADEVLLEKDTDLASNLGDNGYKVLPALNSSQFNHLKEAVKDFIKTGLISSMGIEKFNEYEILHGEFTIENYHNFASKQNIHKHVMQHLRNGIILDRNLPDKTGLIDANIDQIVSNAIGHKVSLYLNTINIRITRPNSSDYNPLHRDVYLPRLRNKINIYLPIAGSTKRSALGLIPGSHKWSEGIIARTPNYATYNGNKFTVPAIVEVSKPNIEMVRVSPDYGELNIFSPYLIHGGGSNPGEETRCSIEARFYLKSEINNLTPIKELSKLGAGTIWYGMAWPPDNKKWKAPSVNDIHKKQIMPILKNTKHSVIFDTAPCYGKSEEMLSKSLCLLTDKQRKKIVISTKVGEYFDEESQSNYVDYSLNKIRESLISSKQLLGDLHIIFIHLTSTVTCENDALEKVIKNSDLYSELMDIKHKGEFGCRKIGITISNEDLLQKIINENLLPNFDVLQIPGWLLNQQPSLVKKWKDRKQGNLVIVNSVARHKITENSFEEEYGKVMENSFVDTVLMGSMNHVEENIKIFKNLDL